MNDDTISRQAAIDAIQDLPYGYRGMVRDIIYNLPSAKQNKTCEFWDGESSFCALNRPSAQRKGKWIATKEWGGRNYSCSCCKFSFIVDTCMLEPMWNFCPNCGAEMKGEQDEAD